MSTDTIAPEQQVATMLLTPERRAQIIRLRDVLAQADGSDSVASASAAAITDLLDHTDAVEWLVLGDEGPPLNKVHRYLRVLGGIATVYTRRVVRAREAGEDIKGHEAASIAALEWATGVLRRQSSVNLSRPDVTIE